MMDISILKHKRELEKELERILHILILGYKPHKVILFGSLVNNKIKETSDLDLFIIKDTPKRYWERVDEVLDIVHPQEAMDIFVLTPQEIRDNLKKNNLYLKDILEEGKVIYERAS